MPLSCARSHLDNTGPTHSSVSAEEPCPTASQSKQTRPSSTAGTRALILGSETAACAFGIESVIPTSFAWSSHTYL
jgi:hypothetical protein